MRKNSLFLTLTMTAGVLLLSVVFAFAANQSATKIGKQGDIWLSRETKIGDLTLKPGHYQIQHEAANGSGHVVVFQQLGDPDLALQYSDEATVGAPAVVSCKLDSLAARAKHTVVTIVPDGNERRITRVEIKGENIAHVF